MARSVNGHLGTFSTLTELTTKFPPSEHIGCSANVGTAITYVKAWCDGVQWAGFTASQVSALGAPKIAPTAPNVLFRFDGSVAAGVGYTVTHTGTGGTAAIDTATSPFTGRNAGPSLKVNAASTRTDIDITGMNMAGFDGHCIVNVVVEDHTAASFQLTAMVGTTGYSRFFQHTYTVAAGTTPNARNGFHAIPCGPMANQDAGATWTPGSFSTFLVGADTMNAVKIRIQGDGVGTRVASVWVHSIIHVPKGRPTMIFTFDDASANWPANALPPLRAAGIKASFGIMAGVIDTNPALYLTAAQVREIAADGHDVCSHNMANTALASPYGAAECDTYAAAFKSGLNALNGVLPQGASSLYHPWVQGASTDLAIKRLRSHGVRVARVASPSRHNIIAASPCGGIGDGMMQLRCISAASVAPTNMVPALIDQVFDACKKYGTTVVWMYHEIQDAPDTGINTSLAAFRYCVEKAAADSTIAKRSISEFYAEALAEGLV